MDVTRITDVLRGTGLSDNETKVYFALLQLGLSKVQAIVEKTGLPRTFVYEVLRDLAAKGVVGYVIKSGVRHYEAASPAKLKDMLNEKQRNLEQVLPELLRIKKIVKEKPTVELYEGKNGIKTVLENILRMPSGSTLYACSSYRIIQFLEYYFPNFVKRRAKAKIWGKIVQERHPEMTKLVKELKGAYSERRFSPFSFAAFFAVYADNVAFITLREEEPIGVVIKDKDIAKTQLKVFETLWESAERA